MAKPPTIGPKPTSLTPPAQQTREPHTPKADGGGMQMQRPAVGHGGDGIERSTGRATQAPVGAPPVTQHVDSGMPVIKPGLGAFPRIDSATQSDPTHRPGPIIEMRPPDGPVIEMRPPDGPVIEMRPPDAWVAEALDALWARSKKDALSERIPSERGGIFYHPDIDGRELQARSVHAGRRKVVALYDPGSGQTWFQTKTRDGGTETRGPYKVRPPWDHGPVIEMRPPNGPVIEMRPPHGPIIEMRPPHGPIIEMRPPDTGDGGDIIPGPGPIIEMRPPHGPIIEMRPPDTSDGGDVIPGPGPIIEMRPPDTSDGGDVIPGPGPIIEMRPPDDR